MRSNETHPTHPTTSRDEASADFVLNGDDWLSEVTNDPSSAHAAVMMSTMAALDDRDRTPRR